MTAWGARNPPPGAPPLTISARHLGAPFSERRIAAPRRTTRPTQHPSQAVQAAADVGLGGPSRFNASASMKIETPPQPPAPAAEARGRPLIDIVLETLWYRQRITRAELSRVLKISRSTASDLVAQLLETRLVAEVGDAPSRGGRRPVLLEFQDDAHAILGVDMGATHVGVALTNLRGKVRSWRSQPHPVRTDPEGTRQLILELCDQCLDEERQSADNLVGIGVAVPSPVDHRTPDRLSETVLPAWKGQSVFQHLRDRYDVPVFIDNDANLGAVAERWWGAGRGVDHFTYIKLGTGIGAGHIIGGQVFRGATNVAGEIGHLSLDPNGERCVCGNRGCLTTFAGREALVRRTKARLDEGGESVLHGRELTPSAIEEAAEQGDALAIDVVHEAAHYLGIAVAGLLNLLNPGAVILGGGMARAGEHLLVPLRETVIHRTLVNSVAASEIRLSDLGPRSIALGAATVVLATALENPALFPGRRAVA